MLCQDTKIVLLKSGIIAVIARIVLPRLKHLNLEKRMELCYNIDRREPGVLLS